MSELHFRFRINQSFLGYPSHPITVRRGDVNYERLRDEKLHQGDFAVVFPHGERATASMYFGISSRGPYHQLRFCGEHREIPKYVKDGDDFFVVLARMHHENYAILEEVAH